MLWSCPFIKLLFMVQSEQNKNLAKPFGDNHSYKARAVTMKLLDTGTRSVKYNSINDWNNFKETFRHVL